MNKYIIYLAAGNSRRFGTNKLLHPYKGKPLYRYGLDMIRKYCKRQENCSVLVVTQYEEILSQMEEEGIPVVYSPDSPKGMSYSIKAGIQVLKQVISEEDYLIFFVADQPCLSENTLERLACLAEQPGLNVETASVVCHGKPGSPTMFSARLIPELLELQGDEGGRKIIRRHNCVQVEAEEERELQDIDYAQDAEL